MSGAICLIDENFDIAQCERRECWNGTPIRLSFAFRVLVNTEFDRIEMFGKE